MLGSLSRFGGSPDVLSPRQKIGDKTNEEVLQISKIEDKLDCSEEKETNHQNESTTDKNAGGTSKDKTESDSKDKDFSQPVEDSDKGGSTEAAAKYYRPPREFSGSNQRFGFDAKNKWSQDQGGKKKEENGKRAYRLMKNPHRGERANEVFIGGVGTISKEDIEAYFSEFGDLRYVRKKRRMGFGFVKFEERMDMEQVLLSRKHIIRGKSVEVKPAENRAPLQKGTALQIWEETKEGTPLPPSPPEGYAPPYASGPLTRAIYDSWYPYASGPGFMNYLRMFYGSDSVPYMMMPSDPSHYAVPQYQWLAIMQCLNPCAYHMAAQQSAARHHFAAISPFAMTQRSFLGDLSDMSCGGPAEGYAAGSAEYHHYQHSYPYQGMMQHASSSAPVSVAVRDECLGAHYAGSAIDEWMWASAYGVTSGTSSMYGASSMYPDQKKTSGFM